MVVMRSDWSVGGGWFRFELFVGSFDCVGIIVLVRRLDAFVFGFILIVCVNYGLLLLFDW